MARITYLEAIRQAQLEEMQRDSKVILLGEDVRYNVFGSTGGLAKAFPPERVRNTPLSENSFVGLAAGAAMVGLRPIVDITISSFIYPAMDQLVSIVAKSTYLYGGQSKCPLVIRTTMYYGMSTAAQHSDRPYAMLMHVPGLKIIAPSNPADAKGLLKSAIRDDDPVITFEDGSLGSSRGEVPEGEYLVPLGKAARVRSGSDVTVVAIAGSIVHALAAAEQLAQEGISIEVIDPRTLAPLDWPTILESVHRTGHLVVVDPGHRTCSAASEIAATAAEQAFRDLKGPIKRVTAPADAHIPFSPVMEAPLFPSKERIISAVKETLQ